MAFLHASPPPSLPLSLKTYLVINSPSPLQQLPMRGPRSQIEGTGVEEESAALSPHYHGEFRKADVVADAHTEREAVGGLDDGDAERGREREREEEIEDRGVLFYWLLLLAGSLSLPPSLPPSLLIPVSACQSIRFLEHYFARHINVK